MPTTGSQKRTTALLRFFQATLLAQIIFFATSGFGQQLNVELATTPDFTAPVPVVWGRLDGGTLQLGATRSLLRVATAASSIPAEAPPRVNVESVKPSTPPQPESGAARLATRYALKESGNACATSVRFDVFLQLLKSLKDKVTGVVFHGVDDECYAAAKPKIERLGLVIEQQADSGEPWLGVEFSTKPVPPVVAEEKPAPAEDAAAAAEAAKPKPVIVSIGGKAVEIAEGGWFVHQARGYGKLPVVVMQGQAILYEAEVAPWPIAAGESAGFPGSGIDVVSVKGGAASPRAWYQFRAPAASPVMLDLFAGGGFTIGRGLPDEAEGKRMSAAITAVKKDVLYGFGVRGAAMLTYAKNSALAWTTLADGLVTRQHAFSRGFWGYGAGGRYFQAKIAAKDTESKHVPEQVLAPMLEANGELGYDDFLVGLRLGFVPLYVQGAGFHPSFNPAAEFGWIAFARTAVVTGFRSDTVKYPTQVDETSLRLDTFYVSIRRGL